jgi:hypothetical protein
VPRAVEVLTGEPQPVADNHGNSPKTLSDSPILLTGGLLWLTARESGSYGGVNREVEGEGVAR